MYKLEHTVKTNKLSTNKQVNFKIIFVLHLLITPMDLDKITTT